MTMPILYVCKRCGYVLYRFIKLNPAGLKTPSDVAYMLGYRCPRCGRLLEPPTLRDIKILLWDPDRMVAYDAQRGIYIHIPVHTIRISPLHTLASQSGARSWNNARIKANPVAIRTGTNPGARRSVGQVGRDDRRDVQDAQGGRKESERSETSKKIKVVRLD